MSLYLYHSLTIVCEMLALLQQQRRAQYMLQWLPTFRSLFRREPMLLLFICGIDGIDEGSKILRPFPRDSFVRHLKSGKAYETVVL